MSRELHRRKENSESRVCFQKIAFKAWVLRGEKWGVFLRALIGTPKGTSPHYGQFSARQMKIRAQFLASLAKLQIKHTGKWISQYQPITKDSAANNERTKGGQITKAAFKSCANILNAEGRITKVRGTLLSSSPMLFWLKTFFSLSVGYDKVFVPFRDTGVVWCAVPDRKVWENVKVFVSLCNSIFK